ncbi:Oxysterol-binding protein 1 [Tupaia chinensis]|uniref:Oxysterol-binding protein 1 n=1 Tax=Tupaia chinensis TaxID=246437 RepID=L9KW41_TUPCH|nr:Oxysterol-binding protein 1 [Tupaia chinensis]
MGGWARSGVGRGRTGPVVFVLLGIVGAQELGLEKLEENPMFPLYTNTDEANAEKQRLEEKQRLSRKKREAEAMKATEDGTPYDPYKALWFERKKDPVTKELTHIYRGEYWECKEKQDWTSCPDIF